MMVANEEDLSDTIAIIGAGPAGCVLANRLIKLTSKAHVKLYEQGSEKVEHRDVNDLMRMTRGLDHHGTWAESTQQSGLAGRFVPVNTFKGVGGGSLANGGIFMVGRRSDYNFVEGRGQAGVAEKALEEIVQQHKPMETTPPDTGTPAAVFCDGLREQRKLQDQNKGALWIEEDGIYNAMASAKEFGKNCAMRRTAADSFLEEIRDDPRFELVANATVTKLLFEEENSQKVSGFLYRVDRTLLGYKIYSTTRKVQGFRQVILCLGAIETPRLLMLSGVGPQAELDKCGIPTVCCNEAVGKDLWDHVAIFFPVKLPEDVDAPQDFPVGPAGVASFGAERVLDNKSIVFYAASPACAHNIHAEIMIPKFTSPSTWSRTIQVKMFDLLRPLIFNQNDTKLGLVGVFLYTVSSRGSVTLNAKTKKAVVDPAYLQSTDDAAALAEAFEVALKIMRDTNMSVPVPDFQLDPQDIGKAVSSLAGPAWHYAGTCALGRALENDFSVKGISNLRVVDASVFPNNIHANTQCPTMCIAYIAAEKIASDLD